MSTSSTDAEEDLNLTDAYQRAQILEWIVEQDPALVHLDEIAVAFSEPQSDRSISRDYAVELVALLVSEGLLHRVGEFVFAKRAAVTQARFIESTKA